MPLLISVLRNAIQKEYRLLRGKAMECASLIGRFKLFSLIERKVFYDCIRNPYEN
jgi:hypothetical protein